MQEKNQIENQVENQIDKNISCNIFFEQINLINQLPIEERGNVLYMAILGAFRNYFKNQENQIDNQIENTYISISLSLSNSISTLSKTVLDLMNKTLNCKNYSSNYGGKRKGAGRKRKEEQYKEKEINDPYINPIVNAFKSEYSKLFNCRVFLTTQECNKLCELSSDIEDFKETIPVVLSKMKDIDFGFENWKPTASWLLKDSNYTAVLNGSYDRQKKETIFDRWRKEELNDDTA